MRLINPSVTIESEIDGDKVLKFIEKIGRVCYKSEDKITNDSSNKFINRIIKSGHNSVIEHFNVTVRLITDRGVTHQLVRHRIASYSQESTRYVDYNKKGIEYILPPWITDIPIGEYTLGSMKLNGRDVIDRCPFEYDDSDKIEEVNVDWLYGLLCAEKDYKNQIKKGRTPEQARSLLPTATKTEIVVTTNLREWRHILAIRTDKNAHPQIREIMQILLIELKNKIPIIFDDIG